MAMRFVRWMRSKLDASTARSFERLGSNKERQVKVRVISATNADVAASLFEQEESGEPIG